MLLRGVWISAQAVWLLCVSREIVKIKGDPAAATMGLGRDVASTMEH